MPVTKIKITFVNIAVQDNADIWGDATWVFTASVDGTGVGSPKQEFVAKDRQTSSLLEKDWSAVIDVSGKGPKDSVKVSFNGKDTDTFVWDHDLGEVKYQFKY